MSETRPIRKHYSRTIADTKKTKKRNEAVVRRNERSKRTNVEQLRKLDAGNYAAKKERARLNVTFVTDAKHTP